MLFLMESIHGGNMGGHPRTRVWYATKKLDVKQNRGGGSRAHFIDILFLQLSAFTADVRRRS
jgi:hypothetical protein